MNILKSFFRKTAPFVTVGIFCIVIGLFFGFFVEYGWKKYQNQRALKSDEAVMEMLSAMIVLPEELPTLATVTDKEQLLDQPFFAKAENGDKVIIYRESKRAYLFRPSERKIIDMTVLSVNVATPSSKSE